MSTLRHSALAALLVAMAACSDQTTEPLAAPRSTEEITPEFLSEGLGVFQRYVAIGTSISMGVTSDGVLASSQQTSWPAQLARLAHREIDLPLIDGTGCAAPLVAPLATGLRLSGESAALPFLARQCAATVAGVQLPTANVAVDGARTTHALRATPENPDPGHATQYPRVLAPGMTQVSAMESQNPKIVSVELGGNDILGARFGVYPSASEIVPLAEWEPEYRAVVARVDATAKHAVLVGLVNDVRTFPSFRTGAELWAGRATFVPLNVAVSADCENSTNLLFVAVRVPVAAATGAFYRANGLGAFPLSCVNAPSSTNIQDYVLDAADVAAVNAQLAAMNAVIREEARTRGFAYFPLGALYEDVVTKPAFNAITLMTSTQPYGPYVSLDGIHPTAEGQRILADAAARALNATYRFGIPLSTDAPALFAKR